ncbi:MAG: hypothetical protein KJZ93_20765 [Caldilineaceae bacterium]|nr:hypothetical protein [Caldilineaceae bacterium]
MVNWLQHLFRGKPAADQVSASPQSAPAPPFPPAAVTDSDFPLVVLASDRLVLVDCWAEWCAPCQTMSAYMAFLAEDFSSRVLVTALDVDENPATTARYAIMGLPTLLAIHRGEEVARRVGIEGYETLVAWVEDMLAHTDQDRPTVVADMEHGSAKII